MELRPSLDQGLAQGRKIGLVGAAVSDPPEVKEVCREILAAGARAGHRVFAG